MSGPLFMAGFDGTEVPAELATLLRDEQLGGVILFRRNIASLQQLARLTARLREIAARPLLIGVDHEGGRVFRMPPPFTPIPAMAQVCHAATVPHPPCATTFDRDLSVDKSGGSDIVYQLGRLMGQELAAVGITVNFAPVLDIHTNPDNPIIGDRAFSAHPRVVSECGGAMIRGLLDGGVIPCGKHFPGHGDTALDSHLGLPVVAHTWERLHLFELAPFKAAIAEQVPMLMTGHLLCSAIDGALPVTLSKRAIHTLLRGELGYDGVVVTDDLQMGAIATQWSAEEAAVRALAAGCDLALICKDPGVTHAAIRRVREAVASGELSATALDRSCQRVQRLFARIATLPAAPPIGVIGGPAHRALVAGIS